MRESTRIARAMRSFRSSGRSRVSSSSVTLSDRPLRKVSY
uniref:Uncharacterized protein n=1 Tax=Anguilla anguilla TaxID=7936 RepID=A0A0E9VRJ5_ANGAN